MGGDDRFAIPLVGRDAEQAELNVQFQRARSGAFRCVLLEGEPGVGKTRLAQALLIRTRGRATGLRARGYPLGAAMPFGLWAELFDGYLRGRPADEVRRLCGDLVEDLAGLLRTAAAVHGSWRPDVPPAQLREALAVLLSNLAHPQPVVILRDDVHLADASSWEALGYLARTLPEVPVLVLACARLDDLVERSVGRHVMLGLEQEGLLTRLEVERLGAWEVRELAERLLGRPSVPPALGHWLFEQSQGTRCSRSASCRHCSSRTPTWPRPNWRRCLWHCPTRSWSGSSGSTPAPGTPWRSLPPWAGASTWPTSSGWTGVPRTS